MVGWFDVGWMVGLMLVGSSIVIPAKHCYGCELWQLAYDHVPYRFNIIVVIIYEHVFDVLCGDQCEIHIHK